MSPKEDNIRSGLSDRRKSTFFSRIRRNLYPFFLISMGLIIILIITLILLSRTQSFRYWASGYLFNIINNELAEDVKFEFQDISVSHLIGFRLYDVSLTVKGDTVFRSSELDAGLKLRPLLDNKIIINRVVFNDAKIHFFKSLSDSIWVFEKIVKSVSDTLPSSPSELFINIERLEFNNAEFIYCDSTANRSNLFFTKADKIATSHEYFPDRLKINYERLHFKRLNLIFNSKTDFKKSLYEFELEELSCIEANSDLLIDNLTFAAQLDTAGFSIEKFHFKSGKNELMLNTQASNINIFSANPAFDQAVILANISSFRMELDEIELFVPIDIELSGLCKYDVDISGNIDDLKVNVKELKYEKSRLKFIANLRNISSSNPRIQFEFENSALFEKDLTKMLSNFDINGIPKFDYLIISDLKGSFEKDSIFTLLNLRSSVGEFDGNIGLGFKNILSYSGELTAHNADLSVAFNDNALKSSLNGKLSFSGSGDKIEDLKIWTKLELKDSRIMGYSIDELNLKGTSSDYGIIHIDSLTAKFIVGSSGLMRTNHIDKNDTINAKDNLTIKKYSEIRLMGFLNFQEANNPKYDLQTSLSALNIKQIADPNSTIGINLPDYMDAEINIIGEGFDPDKINANFEIEIKKWKINNKYLTLDTVTIAMYNSKRVGENSNDTSSFTLNSNFLELNIKGNYLNSTLFSNLSYHEKKLSEYIYHKSVPFDKYTDSYHLENMDSIHYETDEQILSKESLGLSIRLKDKELIKTLLDYKKLDIDLYVDLIYNSVQNGFNIDINEINIRELHVQDSINNIRIQPKNGISWQSSSKLSGSYGLDSGNLFNLEFSTLNQSNFIFNDLLIENINAAIISDSPEEKSRLHVIASAMINKQINVSLRSFFTFEHESIRMNLSGLKLDYLDKINFELTDPIEMIYSKNEIKIDKFQVLGKQFGTLLLNGTAGFPFEGNNYFKDLKISLYDINLENLAEYIQEDELDIGKSISGTLDSLTLNLNGDFAQTEFNLLFNISDLSLNNKILGDIHANLLHKDKNISGNIIFDDNQYLSETDRNLNNILTLNLVKIPMNLSIDAEDERYNEVESLDVALNARNFPLEILSPFIKEIEGLKGLANISLNIKGKSLNKLEYYGGLDYKTTNFLFNINNMFYSSEGRIKFVTDTITIEEINLYNSSSDLSKGKAVAKGQVILEESNIKEFDIRVYSKMLKILSNASLKSIPSLYGEFIISFGPQPLNIFGSVDEPYITGDINIVRAALNMPGASGNAVNKSMLKYEITDKNNIDFSFVSSSTGMDSAGKTSTANKKTNSSKGKDSESPIDLDIALKFLGRCVLTMDIAGIGQLFAEIGFTNRYDVLRYVHSRSGTQIYGTDIIVKEGSTLNLFKIMDTKGKISFPTGELDNPTLDLEASYKGQIFRSDGSTDPFEVIMYIKGTNEQPNITFGYSIKGTEATGDSAKINENALLLLTLGKTKEDLSESDNNFMSTGESMFSSVTSSLASSALTDFVQSTGFIQSADIDIGTSIKNLDQAKMKFSGEVKGIRWTLGGTVADFAGNNEITIDVPIVNNIFLQLTGSTIKDQSNVTKSNKDWEMKLKYGISW